MQVARWESINKDASATQEGVPRRGTANLTPDPADNWLALAAVAVYRPGLPPAADGDGSHELEGAP